MTVDDTLVQRQLYGGAAQLAVPQRFADISDFRPIPDHQEVRGWEAASSPSRRQEWSAAATATAPCVCN